MEGRGAAAHSAFDQLVSSYGEPRDAQALRGRIAEVEKLPPPTETVEALLATPFPSADELPGLGPEPGRAFKPPGYAIDRAQPLMPLCFLPPGSPTTGPATASWSATCHPKIPAIGRAYGKSQHS